MYKIEDIKEVEGKFWVSFYENPLYPDGKGGQLGDRGKINGIPIMEVKQSDGRIWAVLGQNPECRECEIELDEKRREDIAIQHTSQHILSACFIETTGIPTLSFHMGEEYSTIDLDTEDISDDGVEMAVEMANNIIRSCLPVKERFVTYDEAKHLPLRKKLSPKLRPTNTIRLIEIPGLDLAACSGFHVENTGKIGIMLVIGKERVKGGLTRIYFISGCRADRYARDLIYTTQKLSNIFKVPYEKLPERGEKLLKELKEERVEITKIGMTLAEKIAKDLPQKKAKDYTIRYYEGEEYVTSPLAKISHDQDLLILKTKNRFILTSQTLSIKELITKLREKYPNIKGGGGKAQGNIVGELSLEEVVDALTHIIKTL